MTGLTSELAARSAGLRFDELPDNVVEMARLCVLDWLGVTVVGSQEPAPRILLRTLAPDTVTDGASVIGHGIQVSPLRAAVVNGTSSHILDFDDVNTPECDPALQRQRLEQKFRIITTPHLGVSRAQAVITAVALPRAALDVRAITRLTRHVSSRSGEPR